MISNVNITIKNFKSIKSKSLDLSSNGMTLIKGPSGSGKSTVIESLLYAVTGKPKSCKPLGTSAASSVCLTFDTATGESWKITRSTKPGRLLLERKGLESAEDDEAQSLIHTVFGDKFDVVSYIPQNTGESFMKMSPTSKLNFLEELSFGPDVAIFKKNAKTYLAKKKSQSISASAKHDLRLADLQRVKKPTQFTEPLPKKPECDIDPQSLKNSARAGLREAQNIIEAASDLEKKRIKRDANRIHIQTLENERKELENELDIEGDDIEEQLENSKEAFFAAKKMKSLLQQLPDWAQDKDWEEKNKKVLDKKKDELDELGRTIKKAEDKNTVYFECPSCSESIGYNRITSKAVSQSKPKNVEECQTSISDLMRKESELNKKFIDRNDKVTTALNVHMQIAALVDEWGDGVLDDLQELEDTYGALKDLLNKSSKLKKLRNINSDPELDIRVKKSEADMNKAKKDIIDHQKAFDKADAILDNINAWHRKVSEVKRRNEAIERQSMAFKDAVENKATAEADLVNSCKMLKGAEELKAAVLEAESLALVTLVNEINENAAGYLDAFFADDPIEVSLKTFSEVKSTKTIKPCIKTEIQYKGNDITLDALSGGEQARVIIAFTLALGDIRQSPVVMLDEVTANLDAHLTETIFYTVKLATSGKVVMAVAHQCVDGIFENFVKI